MQCPKCNAVLPEGAAFCNVCGSPVGAPQQTAPQPAATQQAAPQQAAPQQAAQRPDTTAAYSAQTASMPTMQTPPATMPATAPAASKPKKHAARNVLLGILALIIVLAVALVVAMQLNPDVKKMAESTWQEFSSMIGISQDQESEPAISEQTPATEGETTEDSNTKSDEQTDGKSDEKSDDKSDDKTDDSSTTMTSSSTPKYTANPVEISNVKERTDAYGRIHLIFDVRNEGKDDLSSIPIVIRATKSSKDEYGETVTEETKVNSFNSISEASYSGQSVDGYFAAGEKQTVELLFVKYGTDVSYSSFKVEPVDSSATTANELEDHPLEAKDFTVTDEWGHDGYKISVRNDTGKYLRSCKLIYIALDDNGDPWYGSQNAGGGDYYTVSVSGQLLKPSDKFDVEGSYSTTGLDRANWKLLRVVYEVDGKKQ